MMQNMNQMDYLGYQPAQISALGPPQRYSQQTPFQEERHIEYVPQETTVTEFEDVIRTAVIPKERKVIDYCAVEYFTEYVPQVYQDVYVEYVPEQKISTETILHPIQTRTQLDGFIRPCTTNYQYAIDRQLPNQGFSVQPNVSQTSMINMNNRQFQAGVLPNAITSTTYVPTYANRQIIQNQGQYGRIQASPRPLEAPYKGRQLSRRPYVAALMSKPSQPSLIDQYSAYSNDYKTIGYEIQPHFEQKEYWNTDATLAKDYLSGKQINLYDKVHATSSLGNETYDYHLNSSDERFQSKYTGFDKKFDDYMIV